MLRTETNKSDYFSRLPEDIIREIFHLLDDSDIVHIAQTSKFWHHLCNEEFLQSTYVRFLQFDKFQHKEIAKCILEISQYYENNILQFNHFQSVQKGLAEKKIEVREQKDLLKGGIFMLSILVAGLSYKCHRSPNKYTFAALIATSTIAGLMVKSGVQNLNQLTEELSTLVKANQLLSKDDDEMQLTSNTKIGLASLVQKYAHVINWLPNVVQRADVDNLEDQKIFISYVKGGLQGFADELKEKCKSLRFKDKQYKAKSNTTPLSITTYKDSYYNSMLMFWSKDLNQPALTLADVKALDEPEKSSPEGAMSLVSANDSGRHR